MVSMNNTEMDYNMSTTEGEPTELALKVIERLKRMKKNKAILAMDLGISRSYVSQYLAGKYKSDPSNIEEKLEQFLAETEAEWGDATESKEDATEPVQEKAVIKAEAVMPQKVKCFESADYMGVMSVCQSCQEDMGLGIIIGKTGYGKTYALKQYAKLPRVAYIECDDMMSCRDLVEAVEFQLGIPKAGGTIHNRVNRIREFLNVNTGYLLIVDEADKLINKYTTAKLEILRGIFDQADVGIVIAGEPKLEADIRISLARFANRVDFYYELKGLNTGEVGKYLSGWDMTEDAANELALRAVGSRSGCFRLFDRTLNNVIRVLNGRRTTKVTLDIVKEASGMMML